MTREELKKALRPIFIGDGFGTWDIDELVEPLVKLDDDAQFDILRQVTVIWPVSQALTFLFLSSLERILAVLPTTDIPEWVAALLDAYESSGLAGARRFVDGIETRYFPRVRGEAGLPFEEAAARLSAFASGLAGRSINLAVGDPAWTDTETIRLPAEIRISRGNGENLLLYRLIIAFQSGFAAWGTLRPGIATERAIRARTKAGAKEPPTDHHWIESLVSAFDRPGLALSLFHRIETARVRCRLEHELPGLMRDARPLLRRLVDDAFEKRGGSDPLGLAAPLCAWFATGEAPPVRDRTQARLFDRVRALMKPVLQPDATVEEAVAVLNALYPLLSAAGIDPATVPALPHEGRLHPRETLAALRGRQQGLRQRFIEALAAMLAATSKNDADSKPAADTPAAVGPVDASAREGVALDMEPGAAPADAADAVVSPEFISIGERELTVPEELRALIEEIRHDFGEVPARYVSSAMDRAGRSGGRFHGPEDVGGRSLTGETVYPEWDFRRSGFRKNWCRLIERTIEPDAGSFVTDTRRKYRGLIPQLRRRFERIRSQDRFLKRQRDGDDIDVDALVESLSDMRAGLEPSHRLFIRLLKDQRDIAAVFLVDMSASTEGWISTALKESLVLLCEALEVLGDRYAIYGFSGMRRTRSECYRIKTFEDAYDETVRGRITAIAPKDYTRMGPPIRHLTHLLTQVEARIRLMITLSDGKPEDYDDYKGEYAIEDTRHALIEAKAAGIHPFCITIDQQAQEYIAHMYGEVNYTFIDEVRKLPMRIPDIYRNLTT